MKDFAGDTWIVMEGRAEKEDVPLICIGYKYNLNKVLVFFSIKAAGSTQSGEPYLAKIPDKFGNMCTREVARADIISNYLNKLNIVDLYNQARQAKLALKKMGNTEYIFSLIHDIVGNDCN